MAEEYSEETIKYLKDAFKNKDDGDGRIDAEELEECLQLCGFCPTYEDIEFLGKHFDKNGDGKLQISELLENVNIIHAHSVKSEEMMHAFKCFDKNNDGYIRLPELLQLLTYRDFMQVDEARKLLSTLIKGYDKDGDGKFSYAEFVQMYNSSDFDKLDAIVTNQ